MLAVILSAAAFFSTLLGGFFAVKFKTKLNLIMGFTAGVLLGVVSFEILPEIISFVRDKNFNPIEPMVALVAGFLIFHILEKVLLVHHAHEGDYAQHRHPHVGMLSALALAGHSFLDGMGIGLGFQAGTAVGLIVTLAVISHDFTDGMNTVVLMLSHKNTVERAKKFLFLDAAAPILGALSTLFFVASERFLLLYLGFFAGFLLYIGASDILPEAHSQENSLRTVALTFLGVLFVFLITKII